jgi:hypothetical protein
VTRWLVAVVPVLLLAGAGLGEGGSAAGSSAAPSPEFPADGRDAAVRMLRLSDLPYGYTIGDDTGCGTTVENAPENLAKATIAYLPETCSIQFEHWGYTPYVESTALWFRTTDGVAALFALRQELFKYVSGVERLTELPQAGIGEEARLFLTPHAFTPTGRDRPGAVVVWRRGSAIGMVQVAGPSQRRSIRMARRFAAVQDERILHPTPILAGENDARAVPLDDPRIGVPVHWLGRRFTPAHRLPPLRLAYTDGPSGREEGLPGTRANMEYEAERRRTYGVVLDLWRPRQWRRFRRSLPGRQVWGFPCARARRVSLRSGYALVYSGYARKPHSGRCPKRPFNAFVAHAYLPGVVVAVNMPNCVNCADGETGPSAPYNSVRGMTAAVRALHLRRR